MPARMRHRRRRRAQASAGGAALTGAGATFPNPIYTKWFDAYAKKTGVRINYQSIGSGGGIRQFTEGTVDFGATDGPMTDEQIAAVKGNVLHIPTVLGAVVLTYNLPALGAAPLTLRRRHAGRHLPRQDHQVERPPARGAQPRREAARTRTSSSCTAPTARAPRSSSPTTCRKVSPEWKAKVGSATSVNWPIGLGGKGNEGVTQQVKQTEGAIGYVELIYAISNELPYARRSRTRPGSSSSPSLESGDRRRGGRQARRRTPTSGCRSPMRPAPTPIRSRPSPGCWSSRQPRTRPRRKELEDFLDWMLAARGPADGGGPALRAAPGAGDRAGAEADGRSSRLTGRRDAFRYKAVTRRPTRASGRLPA